MRALDDFPQANRPYKIVREEATFWIVNHDDQLFAFAPNTPDEHMQCEYAWNRANSRFEDPCLGSKFTLTGVCIDGPASRNLDRHPVTIQNGELIVNASDTIRGAPPPAATTQPQSEPGNYIMHCAQ